jgi:cellulose synthase/poly-beta-1,6-N-acetylglucosamine synthase-like glycosyltransferase
LEELGGFKEGALAEDTEISARLTMEGHRIKYASDVWTWQENPARLGPYLKQRVRWCRGHLDVAFQYGRLLGHLNRRSVDAEFTLLLPLVVIASMVSYWFASWAVFSALQLDLVLRVFTVFSTVCTSVLIVLAGLAMIYVSKPRRVKSLLWLPFVFGYWVLETFLTCYAVLLIVLRRPRRWVRTEKSGVVASPDFSSEFQNSSVQGVAVEVKS